MKKVSEVVQRVESHYVGDDCIQVTIPYINTIIILNKDGIIYSHKNGSHPSINKYVEDERRKQFPYSNIPTHYSRIGLFGKMNYTNQLLNFEEPYIRIVDGVIIESFAVKDKNEALLINKILTSDSRSISATRKESEEVFSNSTTGKEKKYIIFLNDESMNIGEFDSLEGGKAIILKSNGSNIAMQYVRANFVSLDNFRIDIVDIPVNKYTLEQLKHLSPMLVKTKEPRIPLKLNPGVFKEDIQEAKQMIKSLRK